MLVWFRCKNYSSFKNEAILDMRAVKSYKEHPYNLSPQEDGENLLKIVSIYGANASGKSNFIAAFENFRQIILHSFQKNNKDSNERSVLDDNFFPFYLSSESKNSDTEFEVKVREGEDEYQYGFVYNAQEVKEEWLYKRSLKTNRTMTIFERTKHKIELGGSVKRTCEKYVDAIDTDVLALSFFSSLSLKNRIFSTVLRSIADIFPLESSERTEKTLFDRYFRYNYSEDEKPNLIAFLNAIDVGISDVQVERNPNNNQYDVHFIHLDEDNNPQSFSKNIESAGTIKAVSLYSIMRIVAQLNKTILIDEFNTKLHPLLQKYLIDLFYDGTTSGQLIYTTHDTSLLDKRFMRRDQIWFVEKNNKGESSLYSLSDYKARNDSSFGKDYLAGVYGAIPILKDFSFSEA